MSDQDLRAVGVALVVYAVASLSMGAALFVGLAAVGSAWSLDMPAMYVVQLVALGMGVVWSGSYYRLSSFAGWFTLTGGAGLVALIVLTALHDPYALMAAVVLAVLALVLVSRLPRRRCHACGAQVTDMTCEECGAPATPTIAATLLAGALLRPRVIGVVLVFLLAPVAIMRYVRSPEGQPDAPLVGALVIGPFVIVGLTWWGYRRWYRRRYPDA